MDTATTALLVSFGIGAVLGFIAGYKSLTENNDGPGMIALVGGIGAIVFGAIGFNIQSSQATGIPVQMGVTGGVGVIAGLVCGAMWGDHVANPKATK